MINSFPPLILKNVTPRFCLRFIFEILVGELIKIIWFRKSFRFSRFLFSLLYFRGKCGCAYPANDYTDLLGFFNCTCRNLSAPASGHDPVFFADQMYLNDDVKNDE